MVTLTDTYNVKENLDVDGLTQNSCKATLKILIGHSCNASSEMQVNFILNSVAIQVSF